MVRFRINVTYQRSIVQAKVLHHARYAADMIVAATYETDQSFPWVLPKNAHACELGRQFLEVRIGGRPSFIERVEIGDEVEIVVYDSAGIIGIL